MTAFKPSDWPCPRWIAHRGAGKLAPENTLAAFRIGAVHGFRAFECDVKLSADEVPFLLHDTNLQRTTDARGRAADRPWHELSRIDAGGWHSRTFAGEPLPSLEAIARFCLRNGFFLDLEIKPTPGSEELTGRIVAEHVERLWGSAPTLPLLTSFAPVALDAARRTRPDLPRGLLLDSLRPGWLDEAQGLGCKTVVTNYSVADAAMIASIHDRDMKALVYTVNDPAAAKRLIALGIDGLVTDAVDRFSPGVEDAIAD
ncbi:MAG TPA: glycerophosphodiester phosphodiesterase [Caldimonas sp.]|nr:glycerophosphodiester phosphodiesterase [Caldimonas sp.]